MSSTKEQSAILKLLRLNGVGPARSIEYNLAPRLNLITGDNGLGKTFLLECAWWALTGFWAGYPARPRQDAAKDAASITFQIGKNGQPGRRRTFKYSWDQLRWYTSTKLPMQPLPGLSVFSQADSSFAVWDPAKYLLTKEEQYSGREDEALIRFSRSQVWDGLREEEGGRLKVLCNGLIYDWVRWQEAADQTRFKQLSAVLNALSPDPTKEPLIPGRPVRMLELGDSRDIPTLRFPYGEDVPILLCSAGIQRIVALAYLLVWAWQEHVRTAESMRREPERTIVLLVDEVEAHLHPFWQRVIVPALMNVARTLSSEVETQLIIATHSPLVLASVEPIFDHDLDSLFHLYLEEDSVRLDEVPFVKRGRVDQWLMSDLFGLKQPRSKLAEETIEAAKNLQLEDAPAKETLQQVSDQLVKVLAPDDQFWPRWKYFAEQRGVTF